MTSPNTIIADMQLVETNLRQQIAHLNDEIAGLKSDVAYVEYQRDEFLSASEEADDCREILENLIVNIKKHGNYSKESTIVFLEQARSSLNPFIWAVAKAKGGS